MLKGTSILYGNNTIPGVPVPGEVQKLMPRIIKELEDWGLDFYPPIIEMLEYDQMSEVAAYGGFPVRYPHWKWGMEYNELSSGYEYGLSKIYEMVVNCLHPETLVLTSKGSIFAKDVTKGDVVYVQGETRKVFDVIEQPKGETISISLKSYGRPIVCSSKHKWRILKEGGLVWKEAKDLNESDILVGSDNFSIYQNKPAEISWDISDVISETRPNIQHCVKEIYPPKEMTLELAELMGIILGDGSSGVKTQINSIGVSIDKKLPKYISYVENLFESVFGVKATVETHRKSVNVVRFCSKAAVDFLNSLGHRKGCTFENKRVPCKILQSSFEYRCAFLKGFFDTDGYATDTLGCSGYNHDLICDIQIMLLEMGIFSSVVRRNNGKNDISVLFIQGKWDKRKFAERIGFRLDHKQKGLENLLNTENCTSSGLKLPYVQNLIMEIAKKYNFKQSEPYDENASFWFSLKRMGQKNVGKEVLRNFVDRALTQGFNDFLQVAPLLDLPSFEVESVIEVEEQPTIDIALEGGKHDFTANGLITHNTSPYCYIYCLNSNNLVDNITVIIHALGHSDFFKNNIFFEPTDGNMMNQLADNGTRIRKYMARWGKERVTKFIDDVLRIATLIDPFNAWKSRKIDKVVVRDERVVEHPRRFKVDSPHMEDWINTKEWIEAEKERIEREDIQKQLDIFGKPVKDIFGFIKNHGKFKPWQQDIISILYDEEIYFSPQGMTKMLNEGWASTIDYKLGACEGLISLGQKSVDVGIIQYAKHKAGVLGGQYSENPYKLGFELFTDIEERWDKGKFGIEWEDCENVNERENWDKKLGLGKQKMLDVRANYNDFTALLEFFTPELCEKLEYYETKWFPNGETRIDGRDFKAIKSRLLQRYLNRGLPDIRLVDPNHRNKGHLLMQHFWTGQTLYKPYCKETLISLYNLWGNNVLLETKTVDQEDIIYICNGPDLKNVIAMSREEYES